MRADFRPQRTDFRHERADLRLERIDFGPERADFRPWGDERTDGQNDEQKSPCALQDLVPFGAAAQKPTLRCSVRPFMFVCPSVTLPHVTSNSGVAFIVSCTSP